MSNVDHNPFLILLYGSFKVTSESSIVHGTTTIGTKNKRTEKVIISSNRKKIKQTLGYKTSVRAGK